MTQQRLYLIASALILAGLALIVLGLQQQAWLWQAGLAALALAMLLSFTTRWAPAGAPETAQGTGDPAGTNETTDA